MRKVSMDSYGFRDRAWTLENGRFLRKRPCCGHYFAFILFSIQVGFFSCAQAQHRFSVREDRVSSAHARSLEGKLLYTLIAMQNAHQRFLGKEAHVGSMTNIEVLISTLYVSTISKVPKKSLNHQNP
ncbi:unnamed protein product [Clavelina lepadiformis]|uniref:Uncharacterized protein n=1 Tax=Clavelina lepadiformis TaxID=159417 RepID=A0ABP0FZR8_CLALP